MGPIFDRHISDWPVHLANITEFWARISGGPSIYSGSMPAKHLDLGLNPEHFVTWLGLWDFNCRRSLPPQEAEEMSRLAHGIGERLNQIVLGKETNRSVPGEPLDFSRKRRP